MSILSSNFWRKFNKDEKPFTPLVQNNEQRKFLFSKTILFFWAITGHFGALIHTTKRFESISRIWGILNIFIFTSFCIMTIQFTIHRDSATFASIMQLLLWVANDIWCFCGLIVNIWHFKFAFLFKKVQIEYNGFKNYITFRNNIHQLNNYNETYTSSISQKEFLSYIIILFISILLLNLLPFNSSWCDEATRHDSVYTVNSIIFQSCVTIWNNICSLYAFDVTLLYVSLLHIQRFRNFRKEIKQNKDTNNIYIARKQYYDTIVSNMKMSKKNWEFWVNGSFLFNALYVALVIGIWMTDKPKLWTWCNTNPIQISFVAGLSIIRIMALVYPIARLNTEFHKIPMTLQQYVGWQDEEIIKLDVKTVNAENGTKQNENRQRLASYPPVPFQNAGMTAMIHHGYDSMNNSSILVLPHRLSSADVTADSQEHEENNEENIAIARSDAIDGNEANMDSLQLQTMILKQMMDNIKIERFSKELRQYPLGLRIIGLRMEWGYFKSIFATGLAILFTVWVRSRFNDTGF